MIKESDSKTHGGMRVAQIALGVLAIIIALIVIAYPGFATITLVYFLAILFFIVGIEKIITGIFFRGPSRLSSIGLGILVLILAGLAIAYPVGATSILVLLVGFALLFDGIARIVYGISEKYETKFNRFFSIATGIISIGISLLIIVSPLFGFAFVGFLIGIAILITGIQILVAGLRGQKVRFEPPTSEAGDKINP